MQVNSILEGVLFFSLLGCAAYSDIKRREIPTVIWLSIALISLINFKAVHLLGTLAALPFLIAAIIDPKGIGGGDIKLTAAVGMVMGFWRTLAGLSIGLTIVIAFHGMVKLFYRLKKFFKGKAKLKARMSYPLAPFLAVGFILAYLM